MSEYRVPINKRLIAGFLGFPFMLSLGGAFGFAGFKIIEDGIENFSKDQTINWLDVGFGSMCEVVAVAALFGAFESLRLAVRGKV